jgi:glutamate-1-semialdehyde 2,1-aminomutase
VYAALDQNARRVGDVVSAALSDAGVAHRVQYAGNLFSVFFTQQPVTDFVAAQAAETFRYPALFHAMLEAGVYLPPSPYEAWFVNAAMDEAVLDRIAAAAPAAARAAAAAVPA